MFKPTEAELKTMFERFEPTLREWFMGDETDSKPLCSRLGYLIEQAQAERLAEGIVTVSPSEIELRLGISE